MSGARSFFQLASQITTVYNVQLSGASGDLYADSVAVLSWAAFDWDGAWPHTHHRDSRLAVSNDSCV